jgi:hypothetical protein
MTISVVKADASGAEAFWINSKLGSGANAPQSVWLGLVGQK